MTKAYIANFATQDQIDLTEGSELESLASSQVALVSLELSPQFLNKVRMLATSEFNENYDEDERPTITWEQGEIETPEGGRPNFKMMGRDEDGDLQILVVVQEVELY